MRTAFIKGYKELWDKDFFGVKNVNPNQINLIDRINIWFKASTAQMFVESDWFAEDELHWVRSIEKLETFDEVADLAEKLFTFLKEKQEDTKSQTDANALMMPDHNGDNNSESMDTESKEEKSDKSSDSQNDFNTDENSSDEEDTKEMSGGYNSDNEDTSEEEDVSSSDGDKTDEDNSTEDESKSTENVNSISRITNNELESETDKALSKGLKTMVSNDMICRLQYSDITQIKNLDRHIVGWKEVTKQIHKQFEFNPTKNDYDVFLNENH